MLVKKERIQKRGLALLQVYMKYRRKIPTLESYIQDFYDITDINMRNRATVIETVKILKELYEDCKGNDEVIEIIQIKI